MDHTWATLHPLKKCFKTSEKKKTVVFIHIRPIPIPIPTFAQDHQPKALTGAASERCRRANLLLALSEAWPWSLENCNYSICNG